MYHQINICYGKKQYYITYKHLTNIVILIYVNYLQCYITDNRKILRLLLLKKKILTTLKMYKVDLKKKTVEYQTIIIGK